MAKKTGYKSLTQEEFEKVKLLDGMGLTQVNIAKITGRSSATVSYICGADTFEDYKRNIRATYMKSAKYQTTVHAKQSVVPITDEVSMVVEEELLTDREYLKRIASALERMADAWEASPKKGLFR